MAATTHTVQPSVHPRLLGEQAPARYPLRVAIVPNGRLATRSGAVVMPDGRFVRETVWDDAAWEREFAAPPILPAPTLIAGRHVSLVSLWSHNYYHWMFEALPRLAVLEASGVRYDGLIVPSNISAFHLETLEMMGIDRSRIVPFSGEHVKVEELVWVAPLAPVGFPTEFLVQWLRTALHAPSERPTRRLYVQRRTRRVINERRLLKALTSRGFEVVNPDALLVSEQVELWASTEIAIGPHGAAFANGVFSPSLRVLEFYQPAQVNWSITAALAAAGHEHWSLICNRIPALAPKHHHNMLVPLDEVLTSIEMMGIS